MDKDKMPEQNNQEIIPLSDNAKLSRYIDQKTNAEKASDLIAFSSSLFAEGKSGAIQSLGRIAQGLIKGKFRQILWEEINKKIEAGKIPRNFWEKMRNFHSFSELLEFIDSENPDEERFNAAKAMFLSLVRIDNNMGQEILKYNLFIISLKLSSTQIVILRICYQEREKFTQNSYNDWVYMVCEKMGNIPRSLIDLEEKGLVENGLLTERTYPDKSGISGRDARLSDLGIVFCKNLMEK